MENEDAHTAHKLLKKESRLLQVLLLVLIAFFVACSPRAGTNILKFLFDGVPDQKPKDSLVVSATTGMVVFKVEDDSVMTNVLSGTPLRTDLFYHTPYKDKECGKCHNIEAPAKSSFGQQEVCNTCHEDLQKKYKRMHGPVASGFCTTCHAPHFSENKGLLVRKGQDLCTFCHEIGQVMKNETHADIGKDNCTECHNPHGGGSRFILN